ncbi:hypothetical protein K435DRAFT_785993, partial [Dendrothele bispora CBS 962.96]
RAFINLDPSLFLWPFLRQFLVLVHIHALSSLHHIQTQKFVVLVMPVVPASPLGLIAKGYEGVQGMNMWDMGGIGVENIRVNGVGQDVRLEGLETGYMPVHS